MALQTLQELVRLSLLPQQACSLQLPAARVGASQPRQLLFQRSQSSMGLGDIAADAPQIGDAVEAIARVKTRLERSSNGGDKLDVVIDTFQHRLSFGDGFV